MDFSREAIERIGLRNVAVAYAMATVRSGSRSYEDALRLALVTVDQQNVFLAEEMRMSRSLEDQTLLANNPDLNHGCPRWPCPEAGLSFVGQHDAYDLWVAADRDGLVVVLPDQTVRASHRAMHVDLEISEHAAQHLRAISRCETNAYALRKLNELPPPEPGSGYGRQLRVRLADGSTGDVRDYCKCQR